MPRKRSPVGIAAGKLILAIQKECDEEAEASEKVLTQKVLDRAHTLLQAAQSASASSLLDGRSVVEYLDSVWVELHPSIKPSIEALVASMSAHEDTGA